ncbi:MAG: cytochrome b [Steroidobacterales bacterium]
MMQENSDKYGSVAIALHWWVFVLVVVVGVLGLLHDSWPDKTQAFWINLHALCGLLLWIFVIARLQWRRSHPPPALPPDADGLTRRISAPVHRVLYALLLVIPVIGIVTFVWHGRAFDFGLFVVDFGVHKNRAIFHPTENIHGYLAYALFAIAGLHALAALWHHFVRNDGVLRRMWP